LYLALTLWVAAVFGEVKGSERFQRGATLRFLRQGTLRKLKRIDRRFVQCVAPKHPMKFRLPNKFPRSTRAASATLRIEDAMRIKDLNAWLRSMTLLELYDLNGRVRSARYVWIGNPSRKYLELLAEEIPRLWECFDRRLVFNRLKSLNQFPDHGLGVHIDDFFPELKRLQEASVEAILSRATKPLERAEAWLFSVCSAIGADADLEAAIYLASRKHPGTPSGERIAATWRAQIYDQIVRFPRGASKEIVAKARAGDLSLRQAADVLRQHGSLPGFWTAFDNEEDFMASTMLRTADWFSIGGFDDWWESAARPISGGPQGDFSPLFAGPSLFYWCRSNLALEVTAKAGLEAWLWALANGIEEKDVPWRVFYARGPKPSFRDFTNLAACLVFAWKRIAPARFEDTTLNRAVSYLVRTQLPSGGWPSFGDEATPCLLSTCYATHAIALAKPRGWQGLLKKAAAWLWTEQKPFGYWEIQGGPTVMLTVLALDSIALANNEPVTFRDRQGFTAQETSSTNRVEGSVYNYKGQEWFNPDIPDIATVTTRPNARSAPEILLMCATSTELSQILRLVKPNRHRRRVLKLHAGAETYYLGRFGAFKVAVFKSSMGTTDPSAATLAAASALSFWDPRALIMVGICFGKSRTKHQPGDVIVAERIIPYEAQRVGSSVISRSAIPNTGIVLRNRFENAIDWRFLRPDNTQVSIHVGAVLSGEKLIDDLKFKDRLLRRHPTAIAGEMEGAGVWAAAARSKTEWILVKAVCDWADGQKNDDYQQLAAAAAVSLTHHVLSNPNSLDGI
jgi:nucleoside phosphorylase